ncbi:uncharacterized protein LOC143219726 [Lasioglossum baleicum]|uniref:uncharacterized protein LOC143219726 n=1 Tax=Lasioglossum baleicum TaxID=434251 RepID=UPI003FCE8301
MNLTVSSRLDPTVAYSVDAAILARVFSHEPPTTAVSSTWPHLGNLDLADPEFTSRQPIELLLGANIYALIIREGLRQGAAGCPVAQATTLGWIVTGPPSHSKDSPSNTRRLVLHCSVNDDISPLLQRFWSMDEVDPPPCSTELTADEDECEKTFVRTHARDQTGRYIVRLPLKRDHSLLDEYLELNHMELATGIRENSIKYYLPHHGVFRESSTTTKLRVVFNGSSKTTTGISLNDILHSGPNLLPEIPDLLLRWRCYPIVFAADMKKMYWQIWLADEDRDAQRILWRRDPNGEINEYRLRTVTYGLACAPYLAMRTIRQLSLDEESRFPLAATCLRLNVYMDDVLFGASTIDETLETQKQLIGALKAGGFTLRKWTSNDPRSSHCWDYQNLFPPDVWNHIRSKENPADPASRGLNGDSLVNNTLWWQGPFLLSTTTLEFREYYPTVLNTKTPRKTVLNITLAVASPTETTELLNQYSSFTGLLRSVAWCLTSALKDTCLRIEELDNSRLTIVRCEQRHFSLLRLLA